MFSLMCVFGLFYCLLFCYVLPYVDTLERKLDLHIWAKQCTHAHRYIHTYHQPTNRQTNAHPHAHSQSLSDSEVLIAAISSLPPGVRFLFTWQWALRRVSFFLCFSCFVLLFGYTAYMCEWLCWLSYAHSPLVQSGARPPKTCVHVCVWLYKSMHSRTHACASIFPSDGIKCTFRIWEEPMHSSSRSSQ